MDKAIWKNHNLYRVFSWCIMKATWQPHETIVGMTKVVLEPGQFIFGRYEAAAELLMKPSTVFDCMKWLKANSTIDIKSDNKKSVITIINWPFYQSGEDESDTKSDTKSDNNATTSRQQADTNKKVKNTKKDKKDIYGSFQNVFLTPEEYLRLQSDVKNIDEVIEWFSAYIAEKGYKSKSHNLAIRRWVIEAVEKKQPNKQQSIKDFI